MLLVGSNEIKAWVNLNRRGVRRRWNISDREESEEEERKPVRRTTRSSFPGGKNPPVRRMPEDSERLNISRFQTLLRALLRHRDSWPFDEAITDEEVPDYHLIITNPMDLGTIQ